MAVGSWKFYHTIGEYRFACDWVGNQISKALIFSPSQYDKVVQVITEGTSRRVHGRILRRRRRKAEMLKAIGIHLAVAGECFILGYTDPGPTATGGTSGISHQLKRNGDEGN